MSQFSKHRLVEPTYWILFIVFLGGVYVVVNSATSATFAFWPDIYEGFIKPAVTILAVLRVWTCTRIDRDVFTSGLLFNAACWTIAAVALTSGWAMLPCALVVVIHFGWQRIIRSESLASPEAHFGLVQLARRGRSNWVRCLFLLSALGGLILVFLTKVQSLGQGWFDPGRGVSVNNMADLAQRYAFALFIVQNFAVFLLTPIYLGGAIADERERRTLEMLMTTHLTEEQVVIGKFLSRVLYLGAVLLAGLPILSFTLVWGGVDMDLVIANYLNTLVNLIAVGTFSIAISSRARTALRGTMLCYAILLPAVGVWEIAKFDTQSLFVARPGLSGPLWNWLTDWGAIRVTAAFTLSLWCVGRTAQVLRKYRAEGPPPEKLVLPEEKPTLAKVEALWAPRPPVSDNALVWKERYLHRTLHPASPVMFAPVIGLFLWLFFLSLAQQAAVLGPAPSGFIEAFRSILAVLIFPSALLVCLSLALGTAVSLAWERQKRTFDNLLALPVRRRDIVGAVARGNVLRKASWFGLMLAALLLGAFAEALHPIGVMLFAGSVCAHVVFFLGIGLFLSVISTTSLQAGLRMGIVLLALVVVPFAAGLIWTARPDDFWRTFVNYGVNPLGAWVGSYVGWPEFENGGTEFSVRLRVIGLGITLYTLAGVVFGLLAWWRLERQRG
ncbi:MAG: ABC transporter permease [Planctomycetes bacterium]|nr:ABC transporter permease [Planctomycetota bacterium]